jgi:hypothetical protein
MALIQAIVNFITRTVGRILSALLDWAVVSLFGRVTGHRQLFLWGMVAAAAAWPILLLGVVAPKAALFVFAFVPLSSSVPPDLVRKIWFGVAVLVPVAVGATVAVQSESGRREGIAKSILRGFPITAGLALAFLILLVTVPALRVASMLRGHRDTYVPLVTTPESYPVAARVVLDTLRRHRVEMIAVEPPWWAALPSQILQWLGQGAFTGYVADQSPTERALKPCYTRMRCCSEDRAASRRGPTRSRSRPSRVTRTCSRPCRPKRRRSSVKSSESGRPIG